MHAWGLRPRGAWARLAMAARSVLPSVQANAVGAPDKTISRLNTQPALSPVNACPDASRQPSHDSGTVWFAIPSLSETFTRYTLPASPGASRLRPFPCEKRCRPTALPGLCAGPLGFEFPLEAQGLFRQGV